MRVSRLLTLLIAIFAFSGSSVHAAAVWGGNYSAALKVAGKEKKLVLLQFTGSTWCPPCIAMEEGIFSTEAFAAFAEKNLVLVKVDFLNPMQIAPSLYQSQQEKLVGKFAPRYFPTFVLIDSEGTPLAAEKGMFTSSPEGFLAWVRKVQLGSKS